MQSFGHKTVISSQSKLHIQSKNFFNKSCYIWYSDKHWVIIKHNYVVIWSQMWLWELVTLGACDFGSLRLWELATLGFGDFMSMCLWELLTLRVTTGASDFGSIWLRDYVTFGACAYRSMWLWEHVTSEAHDFCSMWLWEHMTFSYLGLFGLCLKSTWHN